MCELREERGLPFFTMELIEAARCKPFHGAVNGALARFGL
jgi:hypothetical protein